MSTLRKSSGRGQSHSHGRVHALEVKLHSYRRVHDTEEQRAAETSVVVSRIQAELAAWHCELQRQRRQRRIACRDDEGSPATDESDSDEDGDGGQVERSAEGHRLHHVADVTLHDRSFLLLVTRGHKYDYECLVRALRACPAPAYIGMIGSRRRVRATYVQLLEEGIDRELLDRIHAPVGLDIGAETPEEIAVSVAAELVMLDRGGSGSSLKDLERVASRFFSDTSLCKNPDDGEPPEENFKATET